MSLRIQPYGLRFVSLTQFMSFSGLPEDSMRSVVMDCISVDMASRPVGPGRFAIYLFSFPTCLRSMIIYIFTFASLVHSM